MRRHSPARTGPLDLAWSDSALRRRALGLGVYVAGSVVGAVVIAGALGGAGALRIVLAGLGGGVVAGALAVCLGLLLGDGAAIAIRALVAPSGASTPYQPTFSRQEALAAKGDVAGALASFEELIAAAPDAADVRIRAAELYAGRGGNPERAVALLREVRKLPSTTPGEDLYASNRLIDLYLGALRDEGRALVECRRLIERYPRSPAAAGARQVIARIKGRADGARETGG